MADIEERVYNLEQKMAEMDKNQGIFGQALSDFKSALSDFAKSNKELSEAIVNINLTMRDMKHDTDCNKDDIAKLQADYKVLDDQSKVNWIKSVKDNLSTFIAGGGLIYIGLHVSGIIK